jgi:putative MATE family efflux protein
MAAAIHKDVPGMFEGGMSKLLVRLSLPMLTGMVVQLFYNITDTVFISLIDKSDPSFIGGTGLVFPLIFLIIALAAGLMTGVGSVVARAIGEHRQDVLNKAAESALVLGLALGALILVAGVAFAGPLVRLLGAQGDYYRHGLDYFRWMVPFGALMIVVHSVAGVFQGEGQMKRIMVGMMIGTVVNVALDPLFIFVLKGGVQGAAIASVVGQLAALVYLLWALNQRGKANQIKWKFSNSSLALMKKIAVIGFPMAMAQMAMAIGLTLFNRIIVTIDTDAMTAFSLVGRLDQAVLMPIFALSSAMITVVGQNAGRGNFARVRQAWTHGIVMSGALVFVLALLHIVLAPSIYPLFTEVPAVIRYSVLQTRILEFSFLLAAVGIIGRAVFQAIGFPVPALILTIIRTLAIGVPAAALYAYVFKMGIAGVYLGVLTGNVLTAGVGIYWVHSTLKRLEQGTLKVASTAE